MLVQHNHQGKLVLVVEVDADLRSLLCDVVRELELQVAEATDGDGAIQQLMDVEPHVVLTDLRLPGGGFEYVRTIRAIYPSCPIILLASIGVEVRLFSGCQRMNQSRKLRCPSTRFQGFQALT